MSDGKINVLSGTRTEDNGAKTPIVVIKFTVAMEQMVIEAGDARMFAKLLEEAAEEAEVDTAKAMS